MGLLGKIVVRENGDGQVVLRLTEVEAYLGPSDPACHTFGGRRTARVESMWGEAGRAYVYLIYGMHNCLNVVTIGDGAGEAVLLRSAVVVSGAAVIRQRRGDRSSNRNLVNGPGKICQALEVDRAADGLDLCSTDHGLWIEDDGYPVCEDQIDTSARIGLGSSVGEAAEWPLRWSYQA